MNFPGYVEITCPFCERYRHAKEDELAALKERMVSGDHDKDGVVCDDCWKNVQRWMTVAVERERERVHRDHSERRRLEAQTNMRRDD